MALSNFWITLKQEELKNSNFQHSTVGTTLSFYIIDKEFTYFSCWTHCEFRKQPLSDLDKMWISNCNITVRKPRIFCVEQYKVDISNYFRSKNIKILLRRSYITIIQNLMVSEIFLIIILQLKSHFYRSRIEIIFKNDHAFNKKSKRIFLLTVYDAENSNSLARVVL